jgi:carboxyl-terminal processing protease
MRKTIPFVLLLSMLIVSCDETLLGPEPENTAKSNFETLWKTIDENYALFSVKKVNWDSLHAVYGSMISASTSESELWDICTKLLSHLDDGHVAIIDMNHSKVYGSRQLNDRPEDEFSLDVVRTRFLSEYKVVGAGYITYGKIRYQNIGYIYVASFAASNTGNGIDWAYDIDKAVQELYNNDAMIIDVRNNGGGLRVTGNIINSTFIDRDITYFYQRLKTGPGHNDFGDVRPISITLRSGAQRFTKKIVLLTNRFSGSGSEYTAQIFKNLSYSTQIGDTTNGSFGEITKIAQLPNGWVFWYPCSLTTTPDGKSPEGIGIIPDILVENTRADINAGNDRVLNSAINYLSR